MLQNVDFSKKSLFNYYSFWDSIIKLLYLIEKCDL